MFESGKQTSRQALNVAIIPRANLPIIDKDETKSGFEILSLTGQQLEEVYLTPQKSKSSSSEFKLRPESGQMTFGKKRLSRSLSSDYGGCILPQSDYNLSLQSQVDEIDNASHEIFSETHN